MTRGRILAALILCGPAAAALGQGRGEGGIVIRPDAPVYAHSEGDRLEKKGPIGGYVAGITTLGVLGSRYQFEEEHGRVHVAYFQKEKQSGFYTTAWMDPADLHRFYFDCGCDAKKLQRCSPFYESGFSSTWNSCFKEARDKAFAEFKAGPPSTAAESPVAQQKTFGNSDVLLLVKNAIGDEIIVGAINQAKAVAFDLSGEALVSLKKEGVSSTVIEAMLKRSGRP